MSLPERLHARIYSLPASEPSCLVYEDDPAASFSASGQAISYTAPTRVRAVIFSTTSRALSRTPMELRNNIVDGPWFTLGTSNGSDYDGAKAMALRLLTDQLVSALPAGVVFPRDFGDANPLGLTPPGHNAGTGGVL